MIETRTTQEHRGDEQASAECCESAGKSLDMAADDDAGRADEGHERPQRALAHGQPQTEDDRRGDVRQSHDSVGARQFLREMSEPGRQSKVRPP
jgi:hypothetical protein